ncbi:MAG: viperin family antiviral radical SAM protein [Ferrovibrio sp.]|uniref:viperin family antiviral radical SAM protein n=1 Tax=Ferrovibrio sp. TaxID=1917215 RepID=UPI002616A6E6|nr:viperin family antiviral radical SAM protein [Ferrovibrio sp.]MCW0232574.1 viperin family antiviral radical SAM protein [Ferrovibrio sp.]
MHHFVPEIEELVINWHVTEPCNFRCGYCFAAWEGATSKRELWKDKRETGRLLSSLYSFFDPENPSSPLREHLHWRGVRLSLAGGEPTLLGGRLTEIAGQAKSLGFRVSLITNGSRPNVIVAAAEHLDMIGISVDSPNQETNRTIGRVGPTGTSVSGDDAMDIVAQVRSINPNIVVKINTVVSSANAGENLSNLILRLRPNRWKIMRVLPVLSDALIIDTNAFRAFVDRHRSFQHLMTIEDNADMERSYVMVDPHGRFFQNGTGKQAYGYSRPILEIGAKVAFGDIELRPEGFAARYPKSQDGSVAQ